MGQNISLSQVNEKVDSIIRELKTLKGSVSTVEKAEVERKQEKANNLYRNKAENIRISLNEGHSSIKKEKKAFKLRADEKSLIGKKIKGSSTPDKWDPRYTDTGMIDKRKGNFAIDSKKLERAKGIAEVAMESLGLSKEDLKKMRKKTYTGERKELAKLLKEMGVEGSAKQISHDIKMYGKAQADRDRWKDGGVGNNAMQGSGLFSIMKSNDKWTSRLDELEANLGDL